MKTLLTVLATLFSLSLIAQAQFSVRGGVNYPLSSDYEKTINASLVYLSPVSDELSVRTEVSAVQENTYEFDKFVGGFIEGNIDFPLSNDVTIYSGLGVSMLQYYMKISSIHSIGSWDTIAVDTVQTFIFNDRETVYTNERPEVDPKYINYYLNIPIGVRFKPFGKVLTVNAGATVSTLIYSKFQTVYSDLLRIERIANTETYVYEYSKRNADTRSIHAPVSVSADLGFDVQLFKGLSINLAASKALSNLRKEDESFFYSSSFLDEETWNPWILQAGIRYTFASQQDLALISE